MSYSKSNRSGYNNRARAAGQSDSWNQSGRWDHNGYARLEHEEYSSHAKQYRQKVPYDATANMSSDTYEQPKSENVSESRWQHVITIFLT